ncbi:hypothetical protein [uncultured Bacteroides sp.]|uniref:hypothetical protein n=1 Tax=uncultured Bacteroides sp. TaxID=162156 RepID=UPI0026033A05|nr:hypothetical protein [uncultured Bacteroides sp.]
MKYTSTLIAFLLSINVLSASEKIDRYALVHRNNPHVSSVDSLSSLSVGNGHFAFTVDATGLQTFPDMYKNGVPLGTQSDWGWHSFANPEGYKPEETLKEFDFGKGHKEWYACQFKDGGRRQLAADWWRTNPHRLHLGIVGLELDDSVSASDLEQIDQTLDMWKGEIDSRFAVFGNKYRVRTVCHPSEDRIAATISSSTLVSLKLRFPYPTGAHADDACNWTSDDKHSTELIACDDHSAILKRVLDDTEYYVMLQWEGKGRIYEKQKNYFVLQSSEPTLSFTCSFSPFKEDVSVMTFGQVEKAAAEYWYAYWTKGGVVDFSQCTDPRAKELERRVVLSQYLTAIQCSGKMPPQETGLTYNSWFGKFHLEMVWWHKAHFALWGHPEMMKNTLDWYGDVEPIAREIARRQGYDGVRWMKMTDPSGREAPSNVGSFLIWQQPHLIYLAELLYRADPSDKYISQYNRLVQETARFMYSFATYDTEHDRYLLKGLIPAQETLKADKTINPPFELSYWHFAMTIAQQWRERAGMERVPEWDELIRKISPLAYNEDKLYLAAESATDTYQNIRFTSDHMAVLGAVGILPYNENQVNLDYMKNTLHWVWNKWSWNKTWGWDYPMTAMNAARLGEPDKAVGALLMDKRTNTYLVSGHNYQDGRLRIYLPGNGGLLTAVAMMCAGWDGCDGVNPGFPKDGRWNVRWEGLKPLP